MMVNLRSLSLTQAACLGPLPDLRRVCILTVSGTRSLLGRFLDGAFLDIRA